MKGHVIRGFWVPDLFVLDLKLIDLCSLSDNDHVICQAGKLAVLLPFQKFLFIFYIQKRKNTDIDTSQHNKKSFQTNLWILMLLYYIISNVGAECKTFSYHNIKKYTKEI